MDLDKADSTLPHVPEATGGLLSVSFLGLLFTQFLTAVNDNVFRWLAIGIGKGYVARPEHGKILMFGTSCFVVPYLLLAAPAGYLADRFSKRNVIVTCKIAEIVIMSLGIAAIVSGSLMSLFGVVALMGAHSALFAPSKLGSIPELLHPSKISAANGLFGLTTVAAIVLGMVIGSELTDVTGYRGQERWWISATVVIGIAVAGTALSLLIRRTPVRNPARPFPWNMFAQTVRDLRGLAEHRALLRVALGLVFFWSIGSLAQNNIDQFAFEGGATREVAKTPLLAALVMGIGVGSILAGVWSHGRVELGILPLGAFGVACSSLSLFAVKGEIFNPLAGADAHWTASLIWACVLLFMLGTSAGLFSVPLESYLQHRSPPANRGSILAAANFLIFSGILLFSVLFYGLRAPVYPPPDKLPADLARANSPTAQREVEGLAAEFQGAWSAGEPPSIDKYLTRAPASDRQTALVHLIWIDVRERRRTNQALPDFDYLEKYRENSAIVRKVLIQANPRNLLSARQIFLVCGMLTIPVFFYIILLLPQASVKFVVWLATHAFYRIRVQDQHYVPEDRGALLASNHISWIDSVFLMIAISRLVRFVVWAGNFTNPFMRWLANLAEVIVLDPKPKALIRALREARHAIERGELVCIFPEGGITRSGQIQGFRPGIRKIIEDSDIPVVPVYLDGLLGSIFSYDQGTLLPRLPREFRRPITIYYGPPLVRPKVHEIRRAVEELGTKAVEKRSKQVKPVPHHFIRQCKRRLRRSKVADSQGTDLSGGQLLLRTLIVRRLLRRYALAPDEQYVGILLPPSVGGIIANAALALDKRVACNLNYTVSTEVNNACIRLAGIKHVITSRTFVDKMNLKFDAQPIYLEDFKDKPTLWDKIACATAAYAMPAAVLNLRLGLNQVRSDDVITVIFTSGSTGDPKGVMLSHANIQSNAEAVDQVVHLRDDDVLIGILPFFHSFGYTIAMWTVLNINIKGAYHFSPLDAKRIGKLCAEHKGTILLSTPTFLRSYLRRCEKEDFATLNVVVAGAEKLPKDVSDAFEEKFGVRPVEGYGATELSPLVSVNIPPSRSIDNFQEDCREGSVGRTIPGVSAKVTHMETGEELGANQDGMLWIRGPNVMKGYLGREDLTAKVIQDGWYKTGDIAKIDSDGFIHITGRESRFSKIGGEMVPHIQVEEQLNRALGATDELKAAVTSVSDSKKGERLIVLHTKLDKSVDELRKALTEAGLPNIYIPSADSFFKVEKLPVLGTGKLDLKALKELAEKLAREQSEGR